MCHEVVVCNWQIFMIKLVFNKPEVDINTTYHVEETILSWEVFSLFCTFILVVFFHSLDEVFEWTVDFFDFELYFIIGFVGFEIKILNFDKILFLKIKPTLCFVLKKVFLMKIEMINLMSLFINYYRSW